MNQRFSDAFLAGRTEGGSNPSKRASFETGVNWVQEVLLPAIKRANSELHPHGILIRHDLNLDRRSTNHAHADFWLSELESSQQIAPGPKYSINVIGDEVRLYKAHAQSESLGTIQHCDSEMIGELLVKAVRDYGSQ